MARSTHREDHLKALYTLESGMDADKAWVSTNALAAHLDVKPPSVTAMIQVLSELGWAEYRPYRGARLTVHGRKLALSLVRKHRLWETFLVDRLGFGWDEVHDIAEQLEHVDSLALVEKLDAYLGHPLLDPHGDPIPTADGTILDGRELVALVDAPRGLSYQVGGVRGSSDATLAALTEEGIELGSVLDATQIDRLPTRLLEELLVQPMENNTRKKT